MLAGIISREENRQIKKQTQVEKGANPQGFVIAQPRVYRVYQIPRCLQMSPY
jgi:hypothetical protein